MTLFRVRSTWAARALAGLLVVLLAYCVRLNLTLDFLGGPADGGPADPVEGERVCREARERFATPVLGEWFAAQVPLVDERGKTVCYSRYGIVNPTTHELRTSTTIEIYPD